LWGLGALPKRNAESFQLIAIDITLAEGATSFGQRDSETLPPLKRRNEIGSLEHTVRRNQCPHSRA
jgi:hypothetical protein